MTNLVALPEGTVLVDDYRIERVLGAGGFGITYLAIEQSLARKITIKEYFPVDFAARDGKEDVCPRSQGSTADYQWGLERFLDEAKTLAKFKHPNIVGVHRYFEARNTGYIVLYYEEGLSLRGWLKSLGRAPRQQELDRILSPLLDALEVIHAADFLHRDIAPDNIIIRPDGSPVLIDFGSARKEVAKHSKAVSALVKPGYSPYEQYATSGRQQGPWTDIYALSATLYQAVSGKRPPDAPSRMVADEIVPVRDAALSAYRPDFLAAIDRGLALDIAERPQTVGAWRKALFAEPKPRRAAAKKEKQALEEAVAAAPAVAAPAKGVPPSLVAALEQAVPSAPTPARAEPPAKAAPRRGLLAEFKDGWRKGPSPRGKANAAKPAVAAEVPPAAKPAVPAPPPVEAKAAQAKPLPEAKAVVPPAPPPRKAPPRALRIGNTRWRSLAVKLVIGLGIAGAAVAFQDSFPRVRREGSQTVLSQSGEQVPFGQLKGHRGLVLGVGFTADGRSVVSTAEDATVKVWSAGNRAVVRSWPLEGGTATAFAVEGRRAATGHKDGSVVLWDVDTGAKVATFKRGSAPVTSLAFAGDPGIVVAAQDNASAVWDARNPASPANVLDGHDEPTQALAYSGRRSLMASGSADRTVKLWNLSDASLVRTYRGYNNTVTALAFAPDGSKLASAAADGQIRLLSALSSQLHSTFRVPTGRITSLAFSPSGEVLASAGEDGILRLWDIKRRRTVRSFQSHTGGLQAIGYSPDGRQIAAAGSDGMVRIWDATVPRPGT